MDRVAVFVDAGYLFAQGSKLLSGSRLCSSTTLDEAAVVKLLEEISSNLSELPLLRIYWYDGIDSDLKPTHTALANQPNMKLRIGTGNQEDVASLIIEDLLKLSENWAVQDAVILTGDEAMLSGIQQTQELGVRVHLVGIENVTSNQSSLLRQEADTLYELSKAEIQKFLSVASDSVPAFSDLDELAERFAASLSEADIRRVVQNPGVPTGIDGQLLYAAFTDNRTIEEDHRRALRNKFVQACKAISQHT